MPSDPPTGLRLGRSAVPSALATLTTQPSTSKLSDNPRHSPGVAYDHNFNNAVK